MTALHPGPSRHSPLPSQMGSRRGSAASFNSDDEDAITPCPVETSKPQEQDHHTTQSPRPRTRRSKSWRDTMWHFDPLDGEGDGVDPSRLWQKMLAIQRVFGCYNSARMRAALEMGTEDGFMPSKTCLDLLNDSISQLPEEARRQVDEFLNQQSGSRRTSTSSWKQRFLHGPS